MTAHGAADSGSRLAVGSRWPWALTAAALVVAGSTGAWATANNVASDHADRDEHRLVDAAESVVADLREALHHHSDLTTNAAARAGEHRSISDAELRRWAAAAHISERHPRVLAIAIVPIAGEPAAIDLTAPQVASLPIDPTFASAGDDATCSLEAPQVVDPCALRRLLEVGLPAAEDLGTVTDHVVASVDPDVALISTPIYSGATVPTTPAARSQQFEGVVVAALDAQGVLDDAALRTDAGVVSRLEHRQLGVERAFIAGDLTDEFELATSRSIGHGWTVQIYAVPPPTALSSSASALGILLAGLAISLLSGSLVYALGTDRSRALRLVASKVDELRHQALHDGLTGLPNRALVTDRLEQLIVRSRRHGTVAAVLYLDVDGFRNINDTLGHEAGDELLDALASRLGATLRNVDTLGRMGGDEFVVLLDGATFSAAPTLVAERLLEVSRQPFTLRSGKQLHVTISIGVAIGDRDSVEEFLHAADAALSRAKSAGRNRYEVFLPEMQASVRRRVELEFDLRSALDNGEFELLYQPIYNLDDLELLGAEALLRWHHPRFGEIKPEAFISILEQTGQIVEVGQWVLTEACRQVASWHTEGSRPGVSVNVSGRQFDDDTIIDHVRDALASSGLPPSSLTIEMTEGAIMRNHTATARRLIAIKQLGVKIAIDDFGTGYSSFAYLREFPIDSLKIDRTFTNGITRSPESQALVRTLVQLGRDLGMKTVAEGVETEEEMDRLRFERVDEAQGYLLARPLSASTFRDTILAGVVRA